MASPDRSSRHRTRPRAIVVALFAVCFVVVAGGPASSATRRQDPVPPAVVREEVRDVMSQSEFDYEPSIPQRVLDWIGDRLGDLFGESLFGGSTFGGGVGSVIAWLLIIAALVGVVVVLVVVLRNRVKRTKPSRAAPPTEIEVEHTRRADDWRREAERLEGEGRWKDALRARYRELVRTLVDRGQVPDIAGRTTGELRVDLAQGTPAAADPFDSASLLFELAWYADVPTGSTESLRFKELATAVLAAPRASDRTRVPVGAAP